MAVILGLDIGSNSVGSAWVDTDARQIDVAASVFPAGVDEREDKRGAPLNQARRQTRSQRVNLARRAARKRRLVRFLIEHHLLPNDTDGLRAVVAQDPWTLRRKAITEPLSPYEFGRVLLHMAQRRGAVGIITDPDDPEEGKVKEGMDRLAALMKARNAKTVGQLMADLAVQRQNNGAKWNEPIRNRQYRVPEDQMLFAGRDLIRQEFLQIVAQQRSFAESALADLLTDELVRQLDDPTQTSAWRHRGILFGQRRTYWDTGTLGRCVLEPTERCVPIADRHASYYRVVETVNNIRVENRGIGLRPLTSDERQAVVGLLRGPLQKKTRSGMQPKSSASVTDIKRVLGINPRDRAVRLNIEADEDRDINTDWFHREIVHGAITEARWNAWDESKREAVNRAILRFDPDEPDDIATLLAGAANWWDLDLQAAQRLVDAWKRRPRPEKRLNLSRRAIVNLLPIMERFDEAHNRWPTQQEARKAYAATLPEGHARRRYESGAAGLSSADRRYMRLDKHRINQAIAALPPAPMLSNPVVRKAIHEVRRHLIAWLRKFGRMPDRIVIEMARVTKQSGEERNRMLARNRFREKMRKTIISEILSAVFGAEQAARLSLNQQRAAVDRVLLARQQQWTCPYCGVDGITDPVAAKGEDLEVDHVVPYSRCGDNGMNNRVLVHRTCNRGKTNQTPREWWGEAFPARLQYAEKLFKHAKPDKGDYFTWRDYARKWENFTRELRDGQEWKNSQLTDTAYAARQVAAYLADALYDGQGLPERGDGQQEQKIFFTMGRITAMLRRDWQLHETLKNETEGVRLSADEEVALVEKDRGDHRQHALDAVAIALTDPGIKNALASWAAQAAEHKERYGKWPVRSPLAPPWGTTREFRRQVLSLVFDQPADDGDASTTDVPRRLIVAHRPVKRRLLGAFHEATHYGPVLSPLPRHRTEDPATLFTNRISADRLTPNHLRVPSGWDQLSAQLSGLPTPAQGEVRRRLAAMVDPSPGKSGIVRDRALRDRIRRCLRANELDPDNFGQGDMKKLVASGKLTMADGRPIKGVVLLRINSEPVIIPRRCWNPITNTASPQMDPTDPTMPDRRSRRVYIGGNNHHVEIRADSNGRWAGEVVPTFEVARRIRPPRNDDGLRQEPQTPVNRSSGLDGQFVMSLSEGEMIYARAWDSAQGKVVGNAGYYVVCKLDKARIHFAPHWDGRKASEQDRWDVSPADFRECGPEPGKQPVKVRVSPLGQVTMLDRD